MVDINHILDLVEDALQCIVGHNMSGWVQLNENPLYFLRCQYLRRSYKVYVKMPFILSNLTFVKVQVTRSDRSLIFKPLYFYIYKNNILTFDSIYGTPTNLALDQKAAVRSLATNLIKITKNKQPVNTTNCKWVRLQSLRDKWYGIQRKRRPCN